MEFLDIIFYLIGAVLAYFSGKWAVKKYAVKIAMAALTGKRYLKEVDEFLSSVSEDFADGEVSSDDLKRAYNEGKDIYEVIFKINESVK